MKPLDIEKEERIINAVYSITAQGGLSGINISAISKKAGVGVGSIYTYFKGKDEIIQYAYEKVKDNFAKFTFKNLDPEQSCKDSIKRIYLNALRYRLKHFEESMFIDLYNQSNYVQLNFKDQADDFVLKNKPFYDILRAGQEKGLIEKTSRAMIVGFVFASVRETTTAILQGVLPMSRRTINDNFNMVWKGISK